nr:hypothetical protein [Sphingomonas sp. CDS-1]
MANGTDEERQALVAEHPDLLPVETMPDNILEQVLENTRKEICGTGPGNVGN